MDTSKAGASATAATSNASSQDQQQSVGPLRPAKPGRMKKLAYPKKPDQYTNRRPVCPMFYLFKSFSLVEFNANDLKNAIQYLKSPSHIADVKIGKVNLVSCLTYFRNEKFVIILDEYHLSHMTFLPVPKWKVLVIAAFNLQGTMFHYLYVRAVAQLFK
ncbi:uncharacterized protein LOC111066810 [Drosophila obscura]|uniref:uncharacterized protein LOC111066810 n=1 Tax=Drosophila obscura TaxID=7282 RepID=UPI001BB14407|nr:uncharacterized protein LOC111066810 [Drosophila obscura]